MIPTQEILRFAGVAVGVILIALLGGLFYRLIRDPTKIWQEREADSQRFMTRYIC